MQRFEVPCAAGQEGQCRVPGRGWRGAGVVHGGGASGISAKSLPCRRGYSRPFYVQKALSVPSPWNVRARERTEPSEVCSGMCCEHCVPVKVEACSCSAVWRSSAGITVRRDSRRWPSPSRPCRDARSNRMRHVCLPSRTIPRAERSGCGKPRNAS